MQLPLIEPREQRQPKRGDNAPMMKHQPSPAAADTTLEFGRFRVLPRQRRLLADGVPVELGTRAFDLLMVLVEAAGALVTKDELRAVVWPGIVVEETNLKVHISALRKALGKDRDFIRTEFGRGYRFTAVVHSTTAGECLSASDATAARFASNAASQTDLSAIVSQLACLEVKLAEALNLLTTESRRNADGFHQHGYCVRSSGRRTRPRRSVDTVRRRTDMSREVLER